MSALQQYLVAVRRQYDFLERALDMDERMAGLEPPPPPYYNGRRHWTHQDRNLVEWEDLSEDERLELLWSANPPRMQRRIAYAVSICRRNLELAKSAALAEAGEMGGFDTLAPLIVEMFRAHDHLCANYAHELDEQEIDWNEAESRHAEALQRLAEFVPAVVTAPPSVSVPAELSVPKRPQASSDELFPLGIPADKELGECILTLVAQRDGTKADYDILLPRFQGQGPLVEAMQAEIRRTRHEGVHTLPENPRRRKRTS